MEMESIVVNGIMATDYSRLPENAVEATKKSVIDTLGTAVAGRKAKGCETIVQLLRGWGGKKEATVLTYNFKIPFPNAVFANSVMSRALDLDEVHDEGTVHPSVAIIPASLGAAEFMQGISGREFIAASAIGIDLICRMSLAPKVGSCVSGMNFSYQCGTFGAAAAVGKILGLSSDQMLNALGIAYSQAAGNSQCYLDGSLTVRVQQGLSAKAGAMSAILAQRGITGAKNFFEGKFGYFNIYHRGDFEKSILVDNFGEHFEGINVSQKPLYPCCKFTHAFIDAAKALANQHKITPDEIYRVKLEVTSSEVYNLVCDPMNIKQNPRTPVDAQFSLPYVVALALVKRDVALDDFSEETIKDHNVLKVARKVEIVFKPTEGRAVLPAPGIIEVQTVGGKQFASKVDFVKGHPQNPNSLKDCIEKMKVLINYSGCRGARNNSEQIADLLLNLEKLTDVCEIISLLNT